MFDTSKFNTVFGAADVNIAAFPNLTDVFLTTRFLVDTDPATELIREAVAKLTLSVLINLNVLVVCWLVNAVITNGEENAQQFSISIIPLSISIPVPNTQEADHLNTGQFLIVSLQFCGIAFAHARRTKGSVKSDIFSNASFI